LYSRYHASSIGPAKSSFAASAAITPCCGGGHWLMNAHMADGSGPAFCPESRASVASKSCLAGKDPRHQEMSDGVCDRDARSALRIP